MAQAALDLANRPLGLRANGELEPAIVLNVRGLTTEFATEEGVVHAVNGISYTLKEGETLGVVGESGCGKTVHALSVLRLVPPPAGRIVAGQVMYQGYDLLQLPEEEVRQIRGREIAMIFQDPMTSLNPVLTVGEQIMEPLRWHLDMGKSSGASACSRVARPGRDPRSHLAAGCLSPRVLRRHASTRHDRHGLGLPSPAADRR